LPDLVLSDTGPCSGLGAPTGIFSDRGIPAGAGRKRPRCAVAAEPDIGALVEDDEVGERLTRLVGGVAPRMKISIMPPGEPGCEA